MKAVGILPGQAGSVSLLDVSFPEDPGPSQVLVKVLQNGVCATDREINQGLYGAAPSGSPYLILGHESLGIIEEVGKDVEGFLPGDLVVPMVRRPCDHCLNCHAGEQDMCLTGDYVETGIKGLHGSMQEYYVDTPQYLVKIPPEQREVGVLMEPLSFAEKVVRQVFTIQGRMAWKPETALVLGSGPIGLLEAFILESRGISTVVAAKSPQSGNRKAEIVGQIGAAYLSTQEVSLQDLAGLKPDIVIEATGDARMVGEALRLAKTNGVVALASVTGGHETVAFPVAKFNLDAVLGNKVVVGVVNAHRQDFVKGVEDFGRFEGLWPGALRQLITSRVPFGGYEQLFQKESGEIKRVLDWESTREGRPSQPRTGTGSAP